MYVLSEPELVGLKGIIRMNAPNDGSLSRVNTGDEFAILRIIMRILLIEPPYYRLIGEKRSWIGVGLLIIVLILKNAGHVVRVYNSDPDFEYEKENILSYSNKFFPTKKREDRTVFKVL